MPIEYREEPCKTALNQTTGMHSRWTLNPYMGCVHRCTYCYVRSYEKRAERPSGKEYGQSIRVKTNVATVLRWELAKRSWCKETVVIGAATDPYQPAEARYRLTAQCIEVLAGTRNPFGLITRGPLIVRDRELLAWAAGRTEVEVNVSVPTLDEEVWRRTEPGTAPPRQRLRAVRLLAESGIRVNVAMAPLLPGISDRSEQLEEVVRMSKTAGATSLWANLLHLRPGTREHFLEGLARDWPELLDSYLELYRRGDYLGEKQTGPTLTRVAELRSTYGLKEKPERQGPRQPVESQLPLLTPLMAGAALSRAS